MENLALVSRQVAVLFALMGVGALCRAFRLIDEKSVKGMVNILVIAVTPCLVVEAFQRPFEPELMHQLWFAFLAVAVIHVMALLMAYVFIHGGRPDTRGVLRVAAAFSNAGFMGLPLEEAILGKEGVFFGIVYVAVFNLFIWSWGLMQIRGGSVKDMTRGEVWKALFNPGFIGLALGVPLFALSVTLPPIIKTPVGMIADLNTPLAMIVIGFYLAGANLKPLFRNPNAYISAIVRLAVFPLTVIFLLNMFKEWLMPGMTMAIAIAASAPAAALNSMFAAKYGKDVDMAVGIVSGTTLLSILTMPPMIALAMEVLK